VLPIEQVRGKDPSVLDITRVRLNGMVRKGRVWQPIDCLSLACLEEFEDVITQRQSVGKRLPGYVTSEVRRYRNLNESSQKSIDHYLSVHGVVIARPEMEVVYGVATDLQIQTYMEEVAVREGYKDWQEYHEWYCDEILDTQTGRGMPPGSHQKWPVILSEFADEGIQDGSHRLHQYIRKGYKFVPFVAFPDELAQIKRIVASWKLRAERVEAHLCSR